MVYQEKFVAVVKCNGKILRDTDQVVEIPFSSEYSLLLKNLDSRKSVVNISIDGEDVLDGKQLVLDGNSQTELEGFLKGHIAKNKFKFIQKTKEIVDYRGDKIDDGIIRIEYTFEKKIEKRQILIERRNLFPINDVYYYPNNWYNPNNIIYGQHTDFSNGYGTVLCSYTNSISSNPILNSQIKEDEGITVKGSEINQNFNYTTINQLEDYHNVIILKLKGIKESGKLINEPVSIQTRKRCSTCGKKSKSNIRYCNNCGTFLD